MKEQIYIDGELMDMATGQSAVQLVYQSPLLTDFNNIVSNRTNNVTLPSTAHNLQVIGRVSQQTASDFPYRKHEVIYLRDGVQIIKGNATILSITSKGISMCFTWGNVSAMQTLFDKNLRDLSGTPYVGYPQATTNRVDFGQGRLGVCISMGELLSKIESDCGVTGLSPLNLLVKNRNGVNGSNLEMVIGLTSRNGDTETKRIQGLNMGTPALGRIVVNNNFYLCTLKTGTNGTDLHASMNEYGIVDVSDTNELRVKLAGTFSIAQYATANNKHTLKLVYDDGNGWNYEGGIVIAQGAKNGTSPDGNPIWKYTCDYDKVIDVSKYERVCLAYLVDVGIYSRDIIEMALTSASITLDPADGEDVIYNSGLRAYPVYANLPDISCGQLIKNLLWLTGRFAYTTDGRTIRLVSFNDVQANKAVALDWTDKMIDLTPSEYKTTLSGTGQKNYFRYAEGDYYDNKNYQGILTTDDETIQAEKEYCVSDFALCPEDRIPVWSKNDDGEFEFNEQPAFLMVRQIRGTQTSLPRYVSDQRWSYLLKLYYKQYADFIRRPVVIKASFHISTYDLQRLDLTIPVYLKQTGRYYCIQQLTTKSNSVADATLIQM